jgi:hypothetical protein
MNLVRHQLGLSKTESRFPAKGTCLAIYSRTVNAQIPLGEVLGGIYPWCAGWETQLRELFALYVEAKQSQNVLDYDDLLLYWAQTMSDARLADDIGGRFDHVLVDEYQDTNRLQASTARSRARQQRRRPAISCGLAGPTVVRSSGLVPAPPALRAAPAQQSPDRRPIGASQPPVSASDSSCHNAADSTPVLLPKSSVVKTTFVPSRKAESQLPLGGTSFGLLP